MIDRGMKHVGTLSKLCGADIELGNFIRGMEVSGGTGYMASKLLLAAMPGLPSGGTAEGTSSSWGTNGSVSHAWGSRGGWGGSYGAGWAGSSHSTDWGRKYLPQNGGSVYIDLDHLELCLPEVVSAWDHLASWHAMLLMVRAAREEVNGRLKPDRRIEVLVNNSDGDSHSYGAHLDFLVTRRCYENIFMRKLHQMLYLASFLVSSIVYTGAGKVGQENGRPGADYQISQRADFFETLTGPQTTFNRPIVNSRDEALCGDRDRGPDGMARLHVIFFDSTLCHVSSLLKVGVTQIILAMMEQQEVFPELILEDPVEAVLRWSHDPGLQAKSRTVARRRYTAVELQMKFLERARRFVARGGAEGIVPRADEILDLWEDTLVKLEKRDLQALESGLDWVLKQHILLRAKDQCPDLAWASPKMKHLDLIYSSLDQREGLYWIYERSGKVRKLVEETEIRRFMSDPPEDTRAWARAKILRAAQAGQTWELDSIDWDSVRFKSLKERQGWWPDYAYHTLSMNDPLDFTREACEQVFEASSSVMDALAAMNMKETDRWGRAVVRPEDNGEPDAGQRDPKALPRPCKDSYDPGEPAGDDPGRVLN